MIFDSYRESGRDNKQPRPFTVSAAARMPALTREKEARAGARGLLAYAASCMSSASLLVCGCKPCRGWRR